LAGPETRRGPLGAQFYGVNVLAVIYQAHDLTTELLSSSHADDPFSSHRQRPPGDEIAGLSSSAPRVGLAVQPD
jgi:hypothetical protein